VNLAFVPWLACLLAAFTPVPAHAQVSLAGVSDVAAPSSAVSSIAVSRPSGVGAGDVLVAMIAQRGANAAAVLTAPAGWRYVGSAADRSRLVLDVYVKAAAAAEPASYTWSLRDDERSLGVVLAFRGVDADSPIVAFAGRGNASATAYVAPSITSDVAGAMLVAFYGAANGNAAVAAPAGMQAAVVGDFGTSAGPNGLAGGAFLAPLAAVGATGTRVSSGNASLASVGALLALRPGAATLPDHFSIVHAGTAVNCQPEPVTITAHTAAHAPLQTTATIDVATSTGRGDWALVAGRGTFVPGPRNGGTASYTYAAADEGTVVLALRDTYPETVNVSVVGAASSERSGTATAAEAPPLTFAPAGFRITNGANVPVTIGPRVAGVSSQSGAGAQALAIQAIRTDTGTGACRAAFAGGTTVSVGLAYQCTDPGTCVSGQTFTVSNGGTTTAIAANPATAVSSYTPVPLRFTTADGEAPIAIAYSDVGRVALRVRYDLPLPAGAASGNAMLGASTFVVRPAGFVLGGIRCASYAAGSCSQALAAPGENPGATSADGPVFLPAGRPMSIGVTAVNAAGGATPNYGRESAPESVRLTPTLVLPAGGQVPPLAGTFGAFAAGTASGSAFSWPEVGIVRLTPSVADGDYLGTGDVIGTTSGHVGRFVPATLAASPNTPVFATPCAAGGFGYVGQPFGYAVPPVVTVTALAADGVTTTRNYTGAFLRLTNTSLPPRTYASVGATALDPSGLPPAAADPAIADLGGGRATLTYGGGSGLRFARTTPLAPFAANVSLRVDVADADGVTAAAPIVFGAGGGIAFSTGAQQRYGRLALRSAAGSELLDLPVRLTVQHWLDAARGFTTSTDDQCTAAPTIALRDWRRNLAVGETCVRDANRPGSSGAGCAAPAPPGQRYRAVALAGDFNLVLAAPGAGNSGAVTVEATAPAWLRFDWEVSAPGIENPSALATFGVYEGARQRVYQREVY
jgi:MSHA biogenesis protein MshQ